MLRMAIVGVGWAGSHHVDAIRELGRKVVVDCIVDNDAQHLEEQAEKLSVDKIYSDYAAVLADPAVDAVSLCTPHRLHAAQAIAAAEAGKHVLVEKPMALSVEEATRMIEAAAANAVTLYVAENLPYEPRSQFLRQVVESGDPMGELTFAAVTAGFRAPDYGYPGRRAWLASPEAGGTWTLHGIHTVAQLRYVFCRRYGEVASVYMREHKAPSFQRADLEGTMTGLLTLASGLSVHVTQTPETKLPGSLGGYVLYGEQSTLRAGKEGYQIFTDSPAKGEEPPLQPYPDAALSSYAQEMEAFTDQVNGVAAGPTTAESERRSLAVVQAGYESVRSQRPVKLEERFGQL